MTAWIIALFSPTVVLIVGLLSLRKDLRALEALIAATYAEVRSGNGLTMAALADRAEGRAVIARLPDPADRTEAEQGYVDAATRETPSRPR